MSKIKNPFINLLLISFLTLACAVDRPNSGEGSDAPKDEDPNATKINAEAPAPSTAAAPTATESNPSDSTTAQEKEKIEELTKLAQEAKEEIKASSSRRPQIGAQVEHNNKLTSNDSTTQDSQEDQAQSLEAAKASSETPSESETSHASGENEVAADAPKEPKDCSDYISEELPKGAQEINSTALLGFFYKNIESKEIRLSKVSIYAEDIAVSDGEIESKVVIDVTKDLAHPEKPHRIEILCSKIQEEALVQVSLTAGSSLNLENNSCGSSSIISGTFTPDTQEYSSSEAPLFTPATIRSQDDLMLFFGLTKESGVEFTHQILNLNDKEIQIRLNISEPAAVGSKTRQNRIVHYTYTL